MRLQCAMLYVKDFARMRRFYEGMLGAHPVNTEWTDRWALFDSGGARFALHAIPTELAGNVEISSPPEPRELSPVKLIFGADDVEREQMRLEAMGITMVRRPWPRPGEACDGIDPEGNVFQIARILS